MTEISFHFNAASRIGHACRLLRKAQRHGTAIAVTGPEAALAELDAELWALAPAEFVAHAWAAQAAAVPARLHASTIWLAAEAEQAPVHEALVNIGDVPPRGFETYQRMVEVVSAHEADRQAARLRWRDYARRGYAIVNHEVGG